MTGVQTCALPILADPIRLEKDIKNVSGATLSCRNVTEIGLGNPAQGYVETALKDLKAMAKGGRKKTRRGKTGGKRTRKH